MQKIIGIKNKRRLFLKAITILLLALVVVYYFCFFIWAFDFSTKYQMVFRQIYTRINPFTLGAYILGVTVLLYYFFYKNIIIKAILGMAYILVISFTFISIMGMSYMKDLIIYIPHLFIIAGCIATILLRKKKMLS